MTSIVEELTEVLRDMRDLGPKDARSVDQIAVIERAKRHLIRLHEALAAMIDAHPVMRTHPIGAPHSPARLAQEDAIRAEDTARALLRGETP